MVLALSCFLVDTLSNLVFTPSWVQGCLSRPVPWVAPPTVQTRCSYSCVWCKALWQPSWRRSARKLEKDFTVWTFSLSLSVDLPCCVTAAACRCSYMHCTVLSWRFVCLSCLLDWTWWRWRADRLELFFFISKFSWAETTLFGCFTMENRLLDSAFWNYLN